MITWLYTILFSGRWCNHIWTVEKKGQIASSSKDQSMIGGDYYILRCSKCGDMKCKNFL